MSTSDEVEYMFKDIDLEALISLIQHRDISGWFKNNEGGENLRFFQSTFAEICDCKYGIAVSSGSAAIYCALKACGIGSGDKVLVPAYTHIGSVAPIVLAGAKPVFVDVDKYGNFNPEEIDHFDGTADALIAVHMLGMPCNMNEIKKRFSGYIIEDASHALGAQYENKKIGSLGNIGCFSIGGGRTKTIGCGEGGMITTNDDFLADKCKNIRNHGDRVTDVDYHCFNFRMSELNALVGLLQLPRLIMLNDWQIKNAEAIMRELPSFFEINTIPDNVKPTFYIISALCPNKQQRDAFLEYLVWKGWYGGYPRMSISGGWSKLVSDIKFYSKYQKRPLTVSADLRDRAVWIDWHRYPRTDHEIEVMLEHVREAVPK